MTEYDPKDTLIVPFYIFLISLDWDLEWTLYAVLSYSYVAYILPGFIDISLTADIDIDLTQQENYR